MLVYKSREDLIQNLKDAGCDRNAISDFMDLSDNGKTKEELDLLSKHRRQMLDKMHDIQKNISCLDYLIYQIKKEA